MSDVYRQRQLQELEDDYSAGRISYDDYRTWLAQMGAASPHRPYAVRQQKSAKKPFVVGISVALAAVGLAALVANETGAVQIGKKATVAPTDSNQTESTSDDAQDVPDEEAHLLDEDTVDHSGGEVYLGEELDPLAYDRGYDFGHMRSYQGLTANRSFHANLCADRARDLYDSESNQSMYIQGCVTGGAGM